MRILLSCLWIAGVVQLAIAAANFVLPKKLSYRENLSRVSPIIRQVFVVHSAYIVGIVLLFAALTLAFAADLASGHGLGRFLAAAMCLFCLSRVPIQLFYYDPALRYPRDAAVPARDKEHAMMPHTSEQWLSLALWLAGIGHFCVLIASAQVPSRLRWKEDLAKLTPFNRKLMWVHGGFAVYTIAAFGAMTLLLHNEMLRGERAAVTLAAFIGLYWLFRIIVDFAYYDHADWPKGRGFVAGHILLNLLFACLSAVNLLIVCVHVFHF